MIQSIYFVNRSSEIFVEKHWTSVVQRSVCDYFFEIQSKTPSLEIPPVIETPQSLLVHVFKNNVHYLAACAGEVPPLFVIEFLRCVVHLIEDYFGIATESSITDNIVCIYEILDELLDSGFPLTTEPNILKEIIRPPTLLRSLADAVTGKFPTVSSTLPSNQLSNVRWRRDNVKYTNNEAYFDVLEVISAIVDRSGNLISAEVHGHIDCLMKLSGTPDLTLNFSNNRLIDDASLHPCVRFIRWKRERILSFVPPDGRFRLFSYHINSLGSMSLPIHLRHNVIVREHGGSLDLVLTPKLAMGRQMEQVNLRVQLPPEVLTVSLAPNIGRCTFDVSTKMLEWDIGRIEAKRPTPQLKGDVSFVIGATANLSNLVALLIFYIPQHTVSGLRIDRVDLYGEKYKPFKGVKYVTKSGKYEIRM